MRGKLTGLQKSYLTTLRLWEVGEGDTDQIVSGKFFSESRGVSWQTSIRKQLQGLVDKGYLDKIVGAHNAAFYQFTVKGKNAANHYLENAGRYTSVGKQNSIFIEDEAQLISWDDEENATISDGGENK